MTEYKVIVDKSTVPVGTADLVLQAIAEELRLRGFHTSYSVVPNPEFLKEGAAIRDALRSPAIVDRRNLYDPKFVRDQGITYLAVGR